MPGQSHPAVLPGGASLITAGLGEAEALLGGDQVPRGQRPDPSVSARHVIGRLRMGLACTRDTCPDLG